MAWDLEFKIGDLTGGIATGDDEVIQRIRTRLLRERGEWFLKPLRACRGIRTARGSSARRCVTRALWIC
ncbi:hypothetical protein [uncultured Bilophila sp.]|uniref:hypothetical protein n=1 Tax=uncultured Bilophila sp. TaxID=529385 RepID=UPI0026701AD2|nr:hypothetical protein [uncultured Bilophila sp.]